MPRQRPEWERIESAPFNSPRVIVGLDSFRQNPSINRPMELPSELQIPPGYDIGNVRAICWGIETGLNEIDLIPFLENLAATFEELEVVINIYNRYNNILNDTRKVEIKIAFSKYSEKSSIKPKRYPCYICGKNIIYWNLISEKVLLDGSINLKSVEICSDCVRKKSKYTIMCTRHLGSLYLGKKRITCPLYPTKCKPVAACPSAQCMNEHAERVHKGYHTRRWKASKRFYSGQDGKVITSNLLTGVEFEVVGKNKECMRTNLYKLGKKIGLDRDHSIDSFYLSTEVVTPPASGRKLEDIINKTSQALIKDNFIVNDRCGLHIHIDLFNKFGHININPDFYKSLLAEYVLWEQVFYSLVPNARSNNPNIRTIGDKYIQYFRDPRSVIPRKFSKIWYMNDDERRIIQDRNKKRHPSKYYWVNFHSLLRKEGLEVRILEGTVSSDLVLLWTRFNHDFINRVAEDQKSYIKFPERMTANEKSNDKQVFEMFIEWLKPKPEIEKFLRARLAMHHASTRGGISGNSEIEFLNMIQQTNASSAN